MTTDERLDRLAERTDAIAQSVEMLSTLHRDIETQTGAGFAKLQAGQARNDERMGQLIETMTRLGNIIIAHEERIERPEDRQAS
jgi:hypothetical protein